jgi:hypothetical protein
VVEDTERCVAHEDRTRRGCVAQTPNRLDEIYDEPIETAFVHRGNVRVPDLRVKGSKPNVYMIDGSVDAGDSLQLLSFGPPILLITKDLKTKYLHVGAATILLVGGNLTADYIIYDTHGGAAVGGKTTAKKIFIYDDLVDPRFGKQPAGVVVEIYDRAEVVLGDVEAHVLFKRMTSGRRFLIEAP